MSFHHTDPLHRVLFPGFIGYGEEANGDWMVTFYGSKATMDLTTAGMDQMYTEQPMKHIEGGQYDYAM